MEITFRADILSDLIRYDEKILESMRKLLKLDSDSFLYNEELNRLIIYMKKENMLNAKIPRNISLFEVISDMLESSDIVKLENPNNKQLVLSRVSTNMGKLIRSLKPSEIYVSDGDEDYYEEQVQGLTYDVDRTAITNNLLVEYLHSFEAAYSVSNSHKANKAFDRIIFYNIFINKALSDEWARNNFNVFKMRIFSDKELMKSLQMSKEDYFELKNEIIDDCIQSLVLQIVGNEGNPKKQISMLDSLLNFKFLITKYPDEDLLDLKDYLSDIFNVFGRGKANIYYKMLSYVQEEIESRGITSTVEEPTSQVNFMDSDAYSKLVGLIKLEEQIFDIFDSIDFNSKVDLEVISSLENLLSFEKDYVSEIEIKNQYLPVVSDILNYNMWIYLKDYDSRKINLIKHRIYTVIPYFSKLTIPSYQSDESFTAILKNSTISSLRFLYDAINQFDDEVMKEGIMSLYKDSFFVNPEVTDEFVLAGGNHLLVDSVSDDILSSLASVSELEFENDKNEQIYKMICAVIDYLSQFEDKIESISDFANYQLKAIEFTTFARELDSEHLNKVKKYLNSAFGFRSGIRRDLVKCVKECIKNSTILEGEKSRQKRHMWRFD